MHTNLLLACFFTLLSLLSHAQTSEAVPQDTITYTPRQLDSIQVDTLVKFVRAQFYERNYDVAIEKGHVARQQADSLGLSMDYFMVSSLIGNSFLQIEDTLQAQQIFIDALQRAELQDSLKYLVSAQIDVGNVYAIQKKNEKAIATYQEAIPIAERLQDSARLFILNYNIADISLDNDNIAFSKPYIDQTDIYIQALEKYEAYRAVHQLLKGRYVLERNPEEALPYLSEGVELAESSHYTDAIIDGLAHLARAQHLSGNSGEAYQLGLRRDSIKNEKYKLDRINAIEAAVAKYKVDQYQQEIENQRQLAEFKEREARRTTTVFWVIVAAFILLISSIFLLISNRKRKKALKELRAKNEQYLEEKERSEALAKAKTTLFSNISHELRTPMYGIIGVTDMLMEDEQLAKKTDSLKTLKFSADYLLSLINNVVLLNKLEENYSETLRKDRIDIRAIIAQVVESSQYLNVEQPNSYDVTIKEEVPKHVIGDRVKITQVLINLIGNATKFTQSGMIRITVSKKDVSEAKKIGLHFEIADTGCGIEASRIPYLFNEFSQTSTGEDYKGTGLGLPIVKKILALHNTELQLESTPEVGTKVSFTIHYERCKTSETSQAVVSTPDANSLKGRIVLVVDDNRVNQLVTQKMLQKYGAEALLASSGPEAIAIVKKQQVDLVLMDINMPEMDGYETTHAIKAIQQDVPVIALSAMELSTIQAHPDFYILDDVITKPYKPETFASRLLAYLS